MLIILISMQHLNNIKVDDHNAVVVLFLCCCYASFNSYILDMLLKSKYMCAWIIIQQIHIHNLRGVRPLTTSSDFNKNFSTYRRAFLFNVRKNNNYHNILKFSITYAKICYVKDVTFIIAYIFNMKWEKKWKAKKRKKENI